MQHHTITHKITNTLLFEGTFPTFKHMLETAISEGENLSHADLRYKNLSHANLDEAYLAHADFTGANLTGANMSEANLYGANLSHTALHNTCFAYSDLSEADFTGAHCGATDIAMAYLDECTFSDISCFTLNFKQATSMQNCRFTTQNGESSHFSKAPIIINGLIESPLIITENTAYIGYTQLNKRHLERILKNGFKTDILNLPLADEA
ncbi:MAG: pentapeptide repeat-containing protein [Alphaproteobacteria bacterium]